jgi:hypothetical protein
LAFRTRDRRRRYSALVGCADRHHRGQFGECQAPAVVEPLRSVPVAVLRRLARKPSSGGQRRNEALPRARPTEW